MIGFIFGFVLGFAIPYLIRKIHSFIKKRKVKGPLACRFEERVCITNDDWIRNLIKNKEI